MYYEISLVNHQSTLLKKDEKDAIDEFRAEQTRKSDVIAIYSQYCFMKLLSLCTDVQPPVCPQPVYLWDVRCADLLVTVVIRT